MKVTVTMTNDQFQRLNDIVDSAFRTSVNHLVSATLADPGEWHDRAPRLAQLVETDRMLTVELGRAVVTS